MERAEAKQLELYRYSTGRPCKRGHVTSRYVHNGMCEQCNREMSAEWRLNNPEKFLESIARSEARRAHVRRVYQRANRDKHKAAKWKRQGIQPPTRPAPLACEICDRPPTGGRLLALDHCHRTSAFRGWLCFGCNTALGRFNDDPTLLRKAISYLEAAK